MSRQVAVSKKAERADFIRLTQSRCTIRAAESCFSVGGDRYGGGRNKSGAFVSSRTRFQVENIRMNCFLFQFVCFPKQIEAVGGCVLVVDSARAI